MARWLDAAKPGELFHHEVAQTLFFAVRTSWKRLMQRNWLFIS